MANMILDNDPSKNGQYPNGQKKEAANPVNLFKGRTEAETASPAKFPDWDIVPPNQFINPRIKLP
jgi:hypothetical protein